MGYLVWQILFFLLLAAGVGFLVAWWLRGAACERRVAELEAEMSSLRRSSSAPPAAADAAQWQLRIDALERERDALRRELEGQRAAPAAAGEPAEQWDGDEPVSEEYRPSALDAPRGEPDDLKRISGVGPKLESTLNGLGIFHYQQIAEWSERNVAWVNRHLRFKGRVEREEWIEQARVLARGGETEFSRRYRENA